MSKRAKHTFTPGSKNLKALKAWHKNPSKSDYQGVDTPRKRKAKKAKKMRGGGCKHCNGQAGGRYYPYY